MRVPRFRSMRAYTILLIAVGMLTSSTVLLAAAVIPLVFVLQGTIARAPSVGGSIEAERIVTPENPVPGEPVEVEVRLEHTGSYPIPDVRFADGVPEELGVADGSPVGGGILRSGKSLSLSYSLVADRGVYEFGDVSVRARNITGTRVTEETVSPSGDKQFDCRVTVEDMPMPNQTTARTGQLATDQGGPGIEFYATRRYRPGDPVKRIDWRQFAKTGELTTIEYREQRAAHVAVITDTREGTHVAADPTKPTGATLSAYAATRAIEVLQSEGHTVSVGALGMEHPQTELGPPAWVEPGGRGSFRARAAEICNAAATELGTARDGNRVATDGGGQTERLRSLLPAAAQLLIVSPLHDRYVLDFVEILRADGHAVTVLSPDISPDGGVGRIWSLERAGRLERLQMLGARVVDWSQDEPLPMALSRALETKVNR